jgi:hypothetical protein
LLSVRSTRDTTTISRIRAYLSAVRIRLFILTSRVTGLSLRYA